MFDVLDDLGRGIKALHALDLDEASDDELSELLVELHRKTAALEAATARITGAWDARAVWTLDGARSGGAWLAHKTRLPGPAARRQVRLAREVRTMPTAETAWEAGEITSEHVSRLAAVRNDRTRQAFARDEAMLVGHAATLSFRHFERALTYWEQHADPDGAEDRAERLHRDRRAFCTQGFDGGWHLDAHLDPIAGTEVHTALDRIERELFDTDWAAAKTEHGDDVALDTLERTPAQRRADALTEMARRAMAAPHDAKRPRPLVTFLVNHDPDTVGRVCELANGVAVTPGQVARVIREADIERAVFNPEGRVVDLGRTTRLFTGAARRAVELTYRQCTFPGCDTPAHQCDIDHIVPWEAGGPTDQTNGAPACPHHHRLRSRGDPYTAHRHPNGTITWQRPDGTPIT